jgi:prevent-host-death family protein
MVVNVSEAKAQLSKLIDLVYHGEEVIIAKHNLPLVDLVPHRIKGKRVLGVFEGAAIVPESFDNEDEDINALFYGK